MSDKEIENTAKQLAKFLTDKNYRYGSKTPLEIRIEKGIELIADEIVDEVLTATPELKNVIRRRASEVISAALKTDKYLSSIVVDAIAKKLKTFINDYEVEEEGEED